MNILRYKDFEGSAELDMQQKICRGKILFIDDLVTYESASIEELQKQFEDAVEDYLETCKTIGKEPQKSCKGQFNVRVPPEIHKAAIRRALTEEISLNEVVHQALKAFLSPQPIVSNNIIYGVRHTFDESHFTHLTSQCFENMSIGKGRTNAISVKECITSNDFTDQYQWVIASTGTAQQAIGHVTTPSWKRSAIPHD